MPTQITFRDAADYGGSSTVTKPRTAETLTATSTSAQSTITARLGEICRITTTADVYVNYGASPTAAASSGDLIPAGGMLDIGPMSSLDKVAVITVA